MLKRLTLPSLFMLFFVLESTILQVLLPHNEEITIVPRLLLVFLMFVAVYISRQTAIYSGLIFGFLYDFIYTDLIGAYAFSLAVVIYFISKAAKYIHVQFLSMLILCASSILTLETMIYLFYKVVGIISINMTDFYQVLVIPTLAFNIFLTGLFYYPVRKLTEKVKDFHEEES
jgi:rod shape-determining protein MreD